jgi:hypothetical protein
VIRSSLTDWRSMKKKCRHARHKENTAISELLSMYEVVSEYAKKFSEHGEYA